MGGWWQITFNYGLKRGQRRSINLLTGILEYPEHTIHEIRTFKIEGITVTCCSWLPFPCAFQCWPRTWTIPPKNHYKITLEERKTGIRAVWPDPSWVSLIVAWNCQLSELIVLQIFAVTLLRFQDVDNVQGQS